MLPLTRTERRRRATLENGYKAMIGIIVLLIAGVISYSVLFPPGPVEIRQFEAKSEIVVDQWTPLTITLDVRESLSNVTLYFNSSREVLLGAYTEIEVQQVGDDYIVVLGDLSADTTYTYELALTGWLPRDATKATKDLTVSILVQNEEFASKTKTLTIFRS